VKPVSDVVVLVRGGFHRIRRRRRRPTNIAASGASNSDRAPVRECNTIKMGEAPVKYELTGASCHLQTEVRGVA
jgi:hypothetical protein